MNNLMHIIRFVVCTRHICNVKLKMSDILLNGTAKADMIMTSYEPIKIQLVYNAVTIL